MKTLLTKDGRTIIIRPAVASDAAGIIRFAKEMFASTDQVVTLPEEYTLTVEQEIDFINSHADKTNAILLVAICDSSVVGFLNFNSYPKKKMSHSGELGMSVSSSFRGNGIGKALLQTLQSWAAAQPGIEKLSLEVFHTNDVAIRLYKQLGFKEEGRKLRAVKQHDGSYADILWMGYFIDM